MPIISAQNVTPKQIRAVLPVQYKSKPYRELKEGDKVNITDCVFSVYQARKNGENLVTKNGEPITSITLYVGMDDGSYTSLKGDAVISQLMALTGFDKENVIGQYPYTFDMEPVKVISVSQKMGSKEYDYLAFE